MLALSCVGLTTEGDQVPVEAVAKTLDQVFPCRRTFGSDPSASFNDYVFFVSDEPLVLDTALSYRNQVRWLESREVDVRGDGDIIITDNLNRLETLHIAKAEHSREKLIVRVGDEWLLYSAVR